MADIVFITAPIGGGKTLFAVKLCLNELRNGRRMIVTNVPLFVQSAPENYLTVGEWCHKYCDEPVDIEGRLRILGESEVKNFFLYLPGNIELPVVEQVTEQRYAQSKEVKAVLPDLQFRANLQASGEVPNGCLYIIDEVHMHYGAREWQVAGKMVEHYMSHLRKLNDDLYLITQHPELVDKNFRRRATEWIHMQNLSKTRLFMGVTFKDRFKAHSFPLQPSRMDKPTSAVALSLMEDEVAKVYDTMSGVGLVGKLQPETSKFKGKHWSIWLVAGIVVLCLAYYIPRAILYSTGRAVGGMMGTFTHGASSALGVKLPQHMQVHQPSRSEVHTDTVMPASVAGPAIVSVESSNVTVVGVATAGADGIIMLSDGRRFHLRDRAVQHVGDYTVQINGTVYRRSQPLEVKMPDYSEFGRNVR